MFVESFKEFPSLIKTDIALHKISVNKQTTEMNVQLENIMPRPGIIAET